MDKENKTLKYIKSLVTQGLFIWEEVIPVSEKTFRQVYERDLALLRK